MISYIGFRYVEESKGPAGTLTGGTVKVFRYYTVLHSLLPRIRIMFATEQVIFIDHLFKQIHSRKYKV